MNDPTDFKELDSFQDTDFYLNRRQHQIAAMLAYGFNSDAIIAEYLGTTEKTVQAQVSIMRKKYVENPARYWPGVCEQNVL